MKNLALAAILFAIVVLGLARLTFGQSLSEGSIVGFQLEPNPLNHSSVYDFELCCGAPQGPGGFLGNGFTYADGEFTAFYKFPGAQAGYAFSGTINVWYTPQSISKYCTVQSGTLKDGSISLPTGQSVTGLVAEYSQLFCQRDGVYWLAGGGLSVHAQ